MAAKKLKCKVCGYIHEGAKAPDTCPLCNAPASQFEAVNEKKEINTSGNLYTIIYSAVMVIVVAAVLAYTALSLKPLQLKNVEIDKKKQILSSILIPSTAEDAETKYSQFIVDSYVVNESGEKVEGDAFSVELESEIKKAAADRKLPVFVAKTDNGDKLVLPVRGAGLWGPLWGYVSLNEDNSTVYGVYFSHKGETPGLGAEIDKEFFQAEFKGKQIIKDGKVVSIAVMKKGQTAAGQDQVDAISGGTITSKGVEDMLKACLVPYEKFLMNR
ncbi:MAG: NADH:ubiquinone reductase (Na(+)-transporting) subunit C [Bacteroidales bacterium]